MAKQKGINQQKKNIKRNGKSGGKKQKQKRVMQNKGPKKKGANSPIYGENSPHPDWRPEHKPSRPWWW